MYPDPAHFGFDDQTTSSRNNASMKASASPVGRQEEPFVLRFEHSRQQVVLAEEVVVEGPFRHPGRCSDLIHAAAKEPRLAELPKGRMQDLFARFSDRTRHLASLPVPGVDPLVNLHLRQIGGSLTASNNGRC